MKWYQDNNGDASSMRIMAFICVIMSCTLSLLAVILNRDLTGAGVLVGAILVPAFGGKAFQARSENNVE